MEDLALQANPEDISTYSNFDKILQQKMRIDARIDFNSKTVYGTVDISFKVICPCDENRVVLDCKTLLISEVKDKQTGRILKFSLYEENPDKAALGTPLVILIDSSLGDSFTLAIKFSSTDESAAIQWLDAHQTLSKKYPFMFTQCEAILARTLIPCQDTPSAKVTVEAILTVEKPLTALFSGIETKQYEHDNLITFEYVQKIPIPTYLIAIGCGQLEYGKISERCGVYTEVGLKDKAVWEFANTEEYLTTAENYLTPYAWGVYNILVLPFAFPYGGMENPCLTFVTPALIAGDRSMTNVIAHEIAHSWTGNLVTNKDWANFWMNEGFTVFMERKICELMYGEEMANLEANVGKDELKAAIESFGATSNFTTLAPDYSNIDPDDGFSVVPYEKGFTFLIYLERLVGKDNFNKILRVYITKYALKSISHKDFRETFEHEVRSLVGEKAETDVFSKINWDEWINTPGAPFINIDFESELEKEAVNLAEQFLNSTFTENAKEIFRNWHTNVKLVFLAHLKDNIEKINEEIYVNLRNLLELHGPYNAEVKHLWYQIALKLKQVDVVEFVKAFLLCHGRMKYIRPVYFAWYAFNRSECLDFFDKHNVAARLIEKKFAAMDELII